MKAEFRRLDSDLGTTPPLSRLVAISHAAAEGVLTLFVDSIMQLARLQGEARPNP